MTDQAMDQTYLPPLNAPLGGSDEELAPAGPKERPRIRFFVGAPSSDDSDPSIPNTPEPTVAQPYLRPLGAFVDDLDSDPEPAALQNRRRVRFDLSASSPEDSASSVPGSSPPRLNTAPAYLRGGRRSDDFSDELEYPACKRRRSVFIIGPDSPNESDEPESPTTSTAEPLMGQVYLRRLGEAVDDDLSDDSESTHNNFQSASVKTYNSEIRTQPQRQQTRMGGNAPPSATDILTQHGLRGGVLPGTQPPAQGEENIMIRNTPSSAADNLAHSDLRRGVLPDIQRPALLQPSGAFNRQELASPRPTKKPRLMNAFGLDGGRSPPPSRLRRLAAESRPVVDDYEAPPYLNQRNRSRSPPRSIVPSRDVSRPVEPLQRTRSSIRDLNRLHIRGTGFDGNMSFKPARPAPPPPRNRAAFATGENLANPAMGGAEAAPPKDNIPPSRGRRRSRSRWTPQVDANGRPVPATASPMSERTRQRPDSPMHGEDYSRNFLSMGGDAYYRESMTGGGRGISMGPRPATFYHNNEIQAERLRGSARTPEMGRGRAASPLFQDFMSPDGGLRAEPGRARGDRRSEGSNPSPLFPRSSRGRAARRSDGDAPSAATALFQPARDTLRRSAMVNRSLAQSPPNQNRRRSNVHFDESTLAKKDRMPENLENNAEAVDEAAEDAVEDVEEDLGEPQAEPIYPGSIRVPVPSFGRRGTPGNGETENTPISGPGGTSFGGNRLNIDSRFSHHSVALGFQAASMNADIYSSTFRDSNAPRLARAPELRQGNTNYRMSSADSTTADAYSASFRDSDASRGQGAAELRHVNAYSGSSRAGLFPRQRFRPGSPLVSPGVPQSEVLGADVMRQALVGGSARRDESRYAAAGAPDDDDDDSPSDEEDDMTYDDEEDDMTYDEESEDYDAMSVDGTDHNGNDMPVAGQEPLQAQNVERYPAVLDLPEEEQSLVESESRVRTAGGDSRVLQEVDRDVAVPLSSSSATYPPVFSSSSEEDSVASDLAARTVRERVETGVAPASRSGGIYGVTPRPETNRNVPLTVDAALYPSVFSSSIEEQSVESDAVAQALAAQRQRQDSALGSPIKADVDDEVTPLADPGQVALTESQNEVLEIPKKPEERKSNDSGIGMSSTKARLADGGAEAQNGGRANPSSSLRGPSMTGGVEDGDLERNAAVPLAGGTLPICSPVAKASGKRGNKKSQAVDDSQLSRPTVSSAFGISGTQPSLHAPDVADGAEAIDGYEASRGRSNEAFKSLFATERWSDAVRKNLTGQRAKTSGSQASSNKKAAVHDGGPSSSTRPTHAPQNDNALDIAIAAAVRTLRLLHGDDFGQNGEYDAKIAELANRFLEAGVGDDDSVPSRQHYPPSQAGRTARDVARRNFKIVLAAHPELVLRVGDGASDRDRAGEEYMADVVYGHRGEVNPGAPQSTGEPQGLPRHESPHGSQPDPDNMQSAPVGELSDPHDPTHPFDCLCALKLDGNHDNHNLCTQRCYDSDCTDTSAKKKAKEQKWFDNQLDSLEEEQERQGGSPTSSHRLRSSSPLREPENCRSPRLLGTEGEPPFTPPPRSRPAPEERRDSGNPRNSDPKKQPAHKPPGRPSLRVPPPLIQKGFPCAGGPGTNLSQPNTNRNHRSWPPLSNADYDLHDSLDVYSSVRNSPTRSNSTTTSIRAASRVRPNAFSRANSDAFSTLTEPSNPGSSPPQRPIGGESSRGASCDGTTEPSPSGKGKGKSVSFAKDLIGEHIFSHESEPESLDLEFCGACKKRHIRSGSLRTLKDRDTCCSMLPEWFPKIRYPKQEWETFESKLTRYWDVCAVLNEEDWEDDSKIKRASTWEAEYHEPTKEWMEARKKGGWWKCRINSEDPLVPQVERDCKVCKANAKGIEEARGRGKEVGWKMMDSRAHGEEIGKKKSLADLISKVEYEVSTTAQLQKDKWEHEKFVRLCMERTMREDKEFVLERIRKSGS